MNSAEEVLLDFAVTPEACLEGTASSSSPFFWVSGFVFLGQGSWADGCARCSAGRARSRYILRRGLLCSGGCGWAQAGGLVLTSSEEPLNPKKQFRARLWWWRRIPVGCKSQTSPLSKSKGVSSVCNNCSPGEGARLGAARRAGGCKVARRRRWLCSPLVQLRAACDCVKAVQGAPQTSAVVHSFPGEPPWRGAESRVLC